MATPAERRQWVSSQTAADDRVEREAQDDAEGRPDRHRGDAADEEADDGDGDHQCAGHGDALPGERDGKLRHRVVAAGTPQQRAGTGSFLAAVRHVAGEVVDGTGRLAQVAVAADLAQRGGGERHEEQQGKRAEWAAEAETGGHGHHGQERAEVQGAFDPPSPSSARAQRERQCDEERQHSGHLAVAPAECHQGSKSDDHTEQRDHRQHPGPGAQRDRSGKVDGTGHRPRQEPDGDAEPQVAQHEAAGRSHGAGQRVADQLTSLGVAAEVGDRSGHGRQADQGEQGEDHDDHALPETAGAGHGVVDAEHESVRQRQDGAHGAVAEVGSRHEAPERGARVDRFQATLQGRRQRARLAVEVAGTADRHRDHRGKSPERGQRHGERSGEPHREPLDAGQQQGGEGEGQRDLVDELAQWAQQGHGPERGDPASHQGGDRAERQDELDDVAGLGAGVVRRHARDRGRARDAAAPGGGGGVIGATAGAGVSRLWQPNRSSGRVGQGSTPMRRAASCNASGSWEFVGSASNPPPLFPVEPMRSAASLMAERS